MSLFGFKKKRGNVNDEFLRMSGDFDESGFALSPSPKKNPKKVNRRHSFQLRKKKREERKRSKTQFRNSKDFGSFTKDSIFGKKMTESNRDVLTSFIFESLDYIEKFMNVEGLFRISGDYAKKMKLVDELNSGKSLTQKRLSKLGDVFCICDLFKDFFKQIPDPIFSSVYEHIVCDSSFNLLEEDALKECLNKLLQPFEMVMLFRLFRLLNKIAEHEQTTKMNSNNLSILFSALLYHRPILDFMQNKERYQRAIKLTSLLVDRHEFYLGHIFKGSFDTDPRSYFKIFLIGYQD